MLDLIIAFILLAIISLILGVAALVISARISLAASMLLATAAAGVLTLHLLYIGDNPLLARIVPLTCAMVLTDLSVPAAAVLVGLVWWRIPGTVLRRLALVVPFIALAISHATWSLRAHPPAVLLDRWTRQVCRQTSDATCTPAAAATVLRACGIPATEREMAELCRTTNSGTSMLGLYRGLTLKLRGTGWRVEPFTGDAVTASGLSILTVGVPATGAQDPRFSRDWGWAPGMRHTVACFGFNADGSANVGDPSVGPERWDAAGFHVLYRGEGFRVVRG